MPKKRVTFEIKRHEDEMRMKSAYPPISGSSGNPAPRGRPTDSIDQFIMSADPINSC